MNPLELNVRLTYTIPPSHKEYRIELSPSGDGWVVNFAYGRIGSALKTGTKTNAPIDYATARKIYDRLLASKVGEGYVADSTTTTADYQPPAAKEDTGIRPQLLTPIALDEAQPYLDDGHWWMQPKYDGNRVFVIAENNQTAFGANRKGQKIALPLPVAQWAQAHARRLGKIVFDGELIGVTYFVFDLLELNGNAITHRPYQIRFSLLAGLARPMSSEVLVAETAKTRSDKSKLLERLQCQHAEGVVFKRMDAPYTPGRLPAQVKCKFWESASFIVKAQNEGVRSIELGLCGDAGEIVGWGNCTVPSNYDLPAVGAIVEVKYLYVDDNVYQPQYKGQRTDIDPAACVPSQLKFKPGSRHLAPTRFRIDALEDLREMALAD